MGVESRILPAEPITTWAAYQGAGGGSGLAIARKLGPAATIDEVDASGLRGRGGGGFPTGKKWRTVANYATTGALAPTVVVNGAEGEPGTFKDRSILRRNPCAVVEGALIAALAVGAERVVIAVKRGFGAEREALRAVIGSMAPEWADGVGVEVATGPDEYLFGEETALLEVIDGRPPFPRIAPPYREGVAELGPQPSEPAGAVLAPGGAPPTLVDNVETLANVAGILAEGADWFRSVGTPESPGTIVCTITGATARHGVAEVAMGTPLAEVIDIVGGGPRRGRRLVAAMSGVANPVLPADRFDTPLSYEAMTAAGSGLGAAGFLVFDDSTDMVAVAAGASRFLAIESCGQCTPCKQDGLDIAARLERLCASAAEESDLAELLERLETVTESRRCYLAAQHQLVVGSIVDAFPDAVSAHARGSVPATPVELIAPVRELADGGAAVLDERIVAKQPDWSFDPIDSGKPPVERWAESEP
ncbi:MAG: SLBB domain-containing protein [Acidobacteria bacterium]|nr:SLBB domain-containing protein [Acidobacteriota bacterium]